MCKYKHLQLNEKIEDAWSGLYIIKKTNTRYCTFSDKKYFILKSFRLPDCNLRRVNTITLTRRRLQFGSRKLVRIKYFWPENVQYLVFVFFYN